MKGTLLQFDRRSMNPVFVLIAENAGTGKKLLQVRQAEREVYWSHKRPVEFFNFDADYLRRLEAQDPATEEHFVAYFTHKLLRPKFGVRGVYADRIDDLVQETLLRAIVTIRNGVIRNPQALGSFVSRVGDNVYHEFRRDELRTSHDDLDGIDVAGKMPGPEELVHQGELVKAVEELMEKLPPRDQAVLRALFLDQKDKDEVCKQYNVKRDHLRLLLHRALKKAEKHLNAREQVGSRR